MGHGACHLPLPVAVQASTPLSLLRLRSDFGVSAQSQIGVSSVIKRRVGSAYQRYC
jgi:hypothetical protein